MSNKPIEWFLARGGKKHGPISEVELQALVSGRVLLPTDMLWHGGMAEWQAVAEMPGLSPPLPADPLPAPGAAPAAAAADTGKPASQTSMHPTAASPGASASPPPTAQPAAAGTATSGARGAGMRRLSIAIYVALVLALMGLSLTSCLHFFQEGTTPAQTFASKDTDRANALVLTMQIVETNLAREQMRLYVSPALTGRLAAGSPRLPAHEIELTLATVNGPRVMMLKRDHHLEPFDIDIPLSDGDIMLYPMDSYRAWIEAEALIAGSGGPGAGGGAQERPPGRVPVSIVFNPRNHTLHIVPSLGRDSDTGDVVVRLDISRIGPIVAFTWFMAGVMAVISLAVALTVLVVMRGRRKPELSMLVWCTALLFALPAVRNNLPGAPPLGALIDYSAFFWAEALVGISMLTLLLLWYLHSDAN